MIAQKNKHFLQTLNATGRGNTMSAFINALIHRIGRSKSRLREAAFLDSLCTKRTVIPGWYPGVKMAFARMHWSSTLFNKHHGSDSRTLNQTFIKPVVNQYTRTGRSVSFAPFQINHLQNNSHRNVQLFEQNSTLIRQILRKENVMVNPNQSSASQSEFPAFGNPFHLINQLQYNSSSGGLKEFKEGISIRNIFTSRPIPTMPQLKRALQSINERLIHQMNLHPAFSIPLSQRMETLRPPLKVATESGIDRLADRSEVLKRTVDLSAEHVKAQPSADPLNLVHHVDKHHAETTGNQATSHASIGRIENTTNPGQQELKEPADQGIVLARPAAIPDPLLENATAGGLDQLALKVSDIIAKKLRTESERRGLFN